MNVLTMPLHLAHLGLHPTRTSSLVGIIILLMQCVFDGCHIFHQIVERLQRIRMEVVSLSQVRSEHHFYHRVLRVCRAFHAYVACSVLLLSAFSLLGAVASNKQWTVFFPSASAVPSLDDDFEHNILEFFVELTFPRAG